MPPFVQLLEQTHLQGDEEVFDGYIVDLLRHLAGSVPFTFSLEKVKDEGGMGRRHRTGEYSGILGELIRKVQILDSLVAKHMLPEMGSKIQEFKYFNACTCIRI